MSTNKDLQRVQDAVEGLGRLFQRQNTATHRASRAGVSLARTPQKVLWHVMTDAPIRVSDLARAVGMSDAVVSRQVSALEDMGLVVRRQSADDGRAAMVQPTAKGRGVGQRLRRAADGIFREQLSNWSAPDLADLADHLERLTDDLRTPRPKNKA